MSASKFIKCVTVGDGAVGKTCMLICYTSNKFPTASFLKNQSISKRERPFLFVLLFLHLFSILSLLHACQYCLWVFFVISLLGFSTPILGHLLGQKVSVLTNNKSFGWQRILCHNALTDHDYIPTVFDNFSTNVAVDGMGALSTRDYGTLQWMPELRRFAPNVPIVLIGTKLDLREDRGYLADHMGSNIITTAQGEELRKQIGAAAYIECSSKTQQNVKAVFDTAIKVVLQPPRRKEVARKKRQRSTGCSIVRGMVCGGCVLDA